MLRKTCPLNFLELSHILPNTEGLKLSGNSEIGWNGVRGRSGLIAVTIGNTQVYSRTCCK